MRHFSLTKASMIYYICKFTSLCQVFAWSEYSAEAFRRHVPHYQYLAILVDLAAMRFVFWFIVVGIQFHRDCKALIMCTRHWKASAKHWSRWRLCLISEYTNIIYYSARSRLTNISSLYRPREHICKHTLKTAVTVCLSSYSQYW